MDMRPESFAPAAPDLTPAAPPTPPERVFSEPGRISEAVFANLDFAEGDAATLAECAGIYESSTLATIAGQLARRLGRIRRELEVARGDA
jgi:hypothetical protein